MESSLQITKLYRKVASLTEELINLRDAQPLLEQTIKSKEKGLAEKEHALRLMEIERQNQRAELEEMERQVTQLQGFLEERSPHNSSVKISGAEDLKEGVTGFKTKLEMEELRREVEGLKQDLSERDSTIRNLRMSPKSARVEDTKVRDLEELVAAYKEDITLLEQELEEARQQMKEDEIAQRGVVDQISVLEGVVENMERGLIAEKKLGERNVKRIRELEAQLKNANNRIEELERDDEERMRRKHTSVDRLPDSHPQKRQTVQFLEQEVEKWKRMSNLSSVGGDTKHSGRRTSTGSGGSNSESPEEVKGLKMIIEQLTRENVQVESENRRLKAKTTGNGVSDGATSGEGALRERLEDAEQEREQLRGEVNELESLLESKIFREEELEKDLERLRNRSLSPSLRRKSSSGSGHRPHSMTPPTNSPPPPPTIEEETVVDESLWCEICEEKGHDILGCKAVFGDKPSATTNRASIRSTSTLNGSGKVGKGERRSVGYCENCDRWDHTTEGTLSIVQTNLRLSLWRRHILN
jgi:CAP-Gly domain-containing linker protein 1